MQDLFKKFLYTGVGLVTVTTEKIQSTIDELIEQGKISEEEGKKVVDDLVENTEAKREEFEGRLRKMIDNVIGKVDFPSRKEVKGLKDRIAELETQLEPKKTTRKSASVKKVSPRKVTAKKTTTRRKATTTKK